jgi:hypothetical protein
MSGGYFEYDQWKVESLAEDIDRVIARSNKLADNPPDKDSYEHCYVYTSETLAKFAEARDALKIAAKMVQRVDWLLSGDDGEETFHKRWKEEIR